MPVSPDEAALGWPDLEDAVGRWDWAAASKLAQEIDQEWKKVRVFVEVFAGASADTWTGLIDTAMSDLRGALAEHPVDPTAVETAMSRFRMLMP